MKYSLGASYGFGFTARTFSNARNVNFRLHYNKTLFDTTYMNSGKAISNVTLSVDITKWFNAPQDRLDVRAHSSPQQ